MSGEYGVSSAFVTRESKSHSNSWMLISAALVAWAVISPFSPIMARIWAKWGKRVVMANVYLFAVCGVIAGLVFLMFVFDKGTDWVLGLFSP